MTESTEPQLQASIISVPYERDVFKKYNIDITDFGRNFCSENDKHGRVVKRRDVEWYWERNVRAEYDTLDPSHDSLISQTKCPKFETFWMEKTAVAALRAEKVLQQQEGFWILKPNAKEKKHFRNALILGNESERWIVPGVSLMAVDDVFFDDFVQNVRAANTNDAENDPDNSKVFQLWGALIKKAYTFVPKEVQIEKLKEAFSAHPPTTEAGLEEFFGTPSKKRKIVPSLRDDAFDDEHSGSTRNERRVSMGKFYVRTFDNESILDPTLKPILKYTYESYPQATTKTNPNVSPGHLIEAQGGERGETPVEERDITIQALKKELAELKIAKDQVEHKLKSKRGRLTAAVKKIEALQDGLRTSQALVARLEERSTKKI